MTDRAVDLSALVETAAQKWPGRVAWTFDPDGQAVTFAEVRDRVYATAGFLRSLGVGEGDRVAVMMHNRPQFPLSWLAAAQLGAVLVPVNTSYRDVDAGYVLRHSGASVMLAEHDFLPLLNRIRSETSLRTIVDVDRERIEASADHPEAPPATRSDQAVNIQYTSGTTGRPKGCVLPQEYWTTLAHSLTGGHPYLDASDVILTAQPFHYIDPQWNVAAGLASGARLVVLDRFHPRSFWKKVREYGVTWFYCLGLMPTLLLRMPKAADDRSHRVRAIHCSAIPPDLHGELEDRWGAPWYEAFGMTETGADIRLGPDDHDEVVGTACLGRPLPHRQVRIADAEGNPAPLGEPGQLLLRGPGLMHGYHEDPEGTGRAFDGGWFHTGDLVRSDSQGRLFYVGRLKDSIRRSGENISAAEVEDTLHQHPAVTIAAVVAVPDDLRGEEVRAFVVADSDASPDALARELDQHCRERLAYFKVPRYWSFRDQLPMTPSERVAKGRLRDEDVHIATVDLRAAEQAVAPPRAPTS